MDFNILLKSLTNLHQIILFPEKKYQPDVTPLQVAALHSGEADKKYPITEHRASHLPIEFSEKIQNMCNSLRCPKS